MVFHEIVAAFHAIFNVVGLPGNLLVIATIALERRFHMMRYILLASLAVSDILCLILTNSFRIASIAQERWLYGQTMCYLNPFFVRYFYFNTVLHLTAVSYERYNAIVKSPLTYDATITKSKAVFIALIWIVPIPFSIGPFLGFGNFVYNPEVFFCEQGWSVQGDFIARNITLLVIVTFVVPFLIIVFLNWRVFKTAKALRMNTVAIQVGNIDGCEDQQQLAGQQQQQQQITRSIREHKAAIDVNIIIAAFLLCYLPGWIAGLCRQFVKSTKVPAEVILSTTCIFFVSSLCNPIIYSIRKREFRGGVRNIFRRMALHGNSSIMDEGARECPNLGTEAPHSRKMSEATSNIIRIDDCNLPGQIE